ncbi:serine protease nudel [Amyelois transitella]|uniref:serine protease nudel n=1 Tax=Amyelois transitella TaxID=680683 RepID=UPI00298FC159|nr:serine protease nudel [Amyelois transitella]
MGMEDLMATALYLHICVFPVAAFVNYYAYALKLGRCILYTTMNNSNNITEKSSSHLKGPPMSLAESKTNGYITTTEIVSLKWISQSSDSMKQSDKNIFFHLKNESSIPKKRSKRRALFTKNNTNVNDVLSQYKDREILKAREIIANHKTLCNNENKSDICKDLVTKIRSLRNTNVHTEKSIKNFRELEKGVLTFQNIDSTELSKRETHAADVQVPKFSVNNVAEPMARDPYANLYPSQSYAVNSYSPHPRPPLAPPPLSETCLLARLLKDNQAHYKGLYNVPSEEYHYPYAHGHPSSPYNRYPPLPSSNLYHQGRDVEPQVHNVHPQDVEILSRFLDEKKELDKVTSKQIPTTREAQCPQGSMSCDDGGDCITEGQWCDGNVDCADVSDEAKCTCRSRVDKSRLCDGYFDCPFGEDEMGCNGCSENTFSCEDVDINSRSTCFTKEQRCNNIIDCPNHRDEFECNSLSPSLHKKPLFAISNTEGFLHRNFRGDWYAVCKNPYMWAHDACRRETGLIIRPPFIQVVPIDPMLNVNYLNTGPGGFIHTSNTCFNSSAIYVTCPDLLCGTRMLSTSQLLRENTAIENRLFGRNKRFLNRYPYDIFNGNRRRHKPKYNVEGERKMNLDDVRNKRAESRVVGGKPSQPAAWPWVAAMYRNGMFHCGGVIITQDWIISAAHCVHEFWKHYYEIQVGMLRRFSFSPQEQNHPVSHVIVNHKYSQSDMKNDLSLLKVKSAIQFSRWVRPICLPGPETAGADWIWGPTPGTMCTAVGWGATVEHGPDPDHMREVELPIWSDCKHTEDREGKEICAGPVEGGKDACQGDSGGPLLCRNPSNSQQWFVAGIVSHGDGCARKGEPGVYTRVSIYVKWIRHHISSSSLPTIQPKQVCPGFKCKSGIFKCLPDKRVCDKIVDCLDGEDERNCSDVRSFDEMFLSRANNDKPLNVSDKPPKLVTNKLNENKKSEKINATIKLLKDFEDNFKHASTLELSISKSSEFEPSDTFEDKITTDSSESFVSNGLNNDPNEENVFAKTFSREALEPMSSVLESNQRESTKAGRGDLKELDTEEEGSTSTQIIEISTTTTEETTFNTESTTNIPVEEISLPTLTPQDNISIGNNTEKIKDEFSNSTSDPDKIESKSLFVELLSTSRPETQDEDSKNLNLDELKLINEKKINKSKKLPDFNDKNDIIHKIEDLVLSELQPAKTRKKHLIPKEFECQHIAQIIPHKFRCDHKADCEDSTDELDCTCTDYLTTFDKNLICDGVFDCADGQDEIDCYSCTEDRFLCEKSQICLPSKYICDGKPQCPQGEDELNCFALSNGMDLTYEVDGKPKIHIEGFLTKKYKSDWHVVCEDMISTEQQEQAADHICRYLGFSSANRYMVKNINIKNEKLFKTNSKTRRDALDVPVHFAYKTQIENDHERHVIIKDPQIIKEDCVPNITKTCMSLYVYCDRSLFDDNLFQELYGRDATSLIDRPWSWIAKVYVEGDYKCSGVLVDDSLVLVGQSCLWDLLLDKQHTVVVLGSHRSINATRGPYEQTIEVVGKTELYSSKSILLHLKEPAVYSSMVKPMVVTSSNSAPNHSICVAVGQNERNFSVSMFLSESEENCSIHNMCFESLMKNKLCHRGMSTHRPWSGIISCHDENGWHPVASFVDSRGECGAGNQIVATEIVHLRSIIRSAEKKVIIEHHEESTVACDGVRCGRGRCINLLQVCNGVHDCEDGNDESVGACEKKTEMCEKDPHQRGCECSSNQLRCHNGKCVSKQLFNNGNDDCGDGTDEPDHLLCSRYLARVMPSGLCDGVLNCEDRSDEDPMFCKCYAEKTYQCGKTSDVNHCVALDVVCDGVRDCPNGEDESTCIGLKGPNGAPSGTGQVIIRSHGIWHTKCYPTENHTRAELESICYELGFLSGHAKEIKSLAKVIPPMDNIVLLNPFSDITLNNMTKLKLRNTQEPLAKGFFDKSLEHCHPVYIECL